jgi:hypothetical protein
VEGSQSSTGRRRERNLLWLGVGGALLAFVMLATLWLYVPTYRPTDEASHVAYARELSHGRLPRIDTEISIEGDPRLARVLRPRDAQHRTIWTANHPPLYYALVAAPLRVGVETGHPIWGVQAARFLSVGLSALGLVVLAYLVLQLVPGRPQLAVMATGLVALLPSFVSISARVYNDSLAFLTTTVVLAAAVVFVVRGPSAPRLTVVAASAGLAALTRASGLLVVGVAGLAVLVGVWRAGEGSTLRRLGRAVIWSATVAVAVVAVAGWFYLRNLNLYGDLIGSAALLEQFGRAPKGTVLGLVTDLGLWRLLQQRLWGVTFNPPGTLGSFTGQLWLLGLVPLAGLLLAVVRRFARPAGERWRLEPGPTIAFGLCVVLLGLLQLSLLQFVSRGGGAHVRYLFPGLVAVALPAAVGLAALPGGRRGVAVVAMLLAMAAVNLSVWWRNLDVLNVSDRPWWLVAVIPVVLVGLGLQAVALWRLAPVPVAMPGQRSSDLEGALGVGVEPSVSTSGEADRAADSVS